MNQKERSSYDTILQILKSDATLLSDSVVDNIMATQREKIKKMHSYAITAPSSEHGRWQTFYKDARGVRKNIKAPSEEALLDKLIPIYFAKTHIDNLTFHELYEEWLEYKTALCGSSNTMKRHKQRYKKYFETSVLDSMKVQSIDELLLDKECNRIVSENNLTRKEWVNAKVILNGMYDYAFRKRYIEENYMSKVVIQVRYKQVQRKTGKTETYDTDELSALNAYLDQKYSETHDYSFMAIRLNFFLGLRVGELVALKWEDLCDDNHLHIVREEIRNQDTNAVEVVEHTKTNTDRFVVLIPQAKEILEKVDHVDEYVFVRDGKRLTSRQINYVLEKFAERMGMHTKSSHKMRKTYASRLNAAGVPLDVIREQLGHSDLTTTLGYIYNPLTEKETYDAISCALK